MEIRRAILLFAIVLGLAALVTSFTRTADDEGGGDRAARPSQTDRPQSDPSATERPATDRPAAAAPTELRFPAGADPVTRSLQSGRAATLIIDVLAPGQVAIEDLGLNAAAQPGTPARFDLLAGEPSRYPIAFTPANGADGRTIGVLRVRE